VIDEFALELNAFTESIHRGRDPEPDGMEGARDMATIEAIYRSTRENRTIPIPRLTATADGALVK
jgi:predicted dehydrogenase